MKPCKTCHHTKPLAAFRLLPSGGRRGTCTDCIRDADRMRHAARRAGLRKTDDLALTGGAWVPGKGGVRRWVTPLPQPVGSR